MRKFFSFRSSSSTNGNNNPASSAPSRKVCPEAPWENDENILVGEKFRDGSQAPEKSVLKPLNRTLDSEVSSTPHLRRSLSFSSPAIYSGLEEENSNSFSDLNRSQSRCGSPLHHADECSLHCRSLTPERYTRMKRGDRSVFGKSHPIEKFDFSCSSRSCQCSSENSPCSSPIPLRCRAARLTQFPSKDKILDLYIDGEHQVTEPNRESQRHSSERHYLAENRALTSSRRPPRARSTAPSSPTQSNENIRTFSFREVKDTGHHLSKRDWTRDLRPVSHAFPEKDFETTTMNEETYVNSLNAQPALNSNGIAQNFSSDPILSYENSIYCAEESLGFQRQSCLFEHESMSIEHDKLISSGLHDHDSDKDLQRMVKELEEKFILLPEEDPEPKKLRNTCLSITALLQTIKNVTEDRKHLAFELSSQIKDRLAERSAAKEQLKQSKVELDIRTRRLEKEKNELQLSLEKELDRRAHDWSSKLGKFQVEEQRLRERVRELAEQNVSLQREVSFLTGNEVETRSRIMNSEMQVNDLTTSLKEVRQENYNVHQALSELQERYNEVEEDRNCIGRSYKEKEKETKDLQKALVRLQRICSDQEKTITGLRQGYSDEIGKESVEKSDKISRLQMEQLRLTSVEQILRREVESCRLEVESLRHENICLLDRLQGNGNIYDFSLIRLDQELRARVDCLQTQGLSLLEENSHFCGELLESIKSRHYELHQEANSDFDGYSVVQFTLKHQSLRRGIGNLRRSLQTILAILEDKSSEVSEFHSQTTEGGSARQWKGQAFEDELELKFKAEAILTSVLREKICYRELEFERIQADLASSVRGHDVLQTEIQRLKDELSCLTQKEKDMELQMMKKDESINQLQIELQESTKDLTATQVILAKISEERKFMWEELKQSRENSILLDYEVKSLRKKIEALDEDMLIKEGQISILKDSMGKKPLDINYSLKS